MNNDEDLEKTGAKSGSQIRHANLKDSMMRTRDLGLIPSEGLGTPQYEKKAQVAQSTHACLQASNVGCLPEADAM